MPVDNRKRRLAILGAVILLATYVSKEIIQSHLEDKLRRIESTELEQRLDERFEGISPNLRSELASGTDLRRALKGKPEITAVRDFPFYFLVEMECDTGTPDHPSNIVDQSCATNEWIRQSDYERRRGENLERLATIIGEDRLDHSKDDLANALELETRAYEQLTLKGADGSPIKPTENHETDYTSAANHLETVVAARARQVLDFREPEIVGRLHLELTIATILSSLLYLAGWLLTLHVIISGGAPIDVGE